MLLGKRRFAGRAVASLPFIAWLVTCEAAGLLVGYVSGPGDSPRRLQ
jgi:hypothetical protein